MVKNISNPLNARKVAKIITEDALEQDHKVNERKISVFLSDHKYGDLNLAINQLKQDGIITSSYELSPSCKEKLIELGFLEKNAISEFEQNNKQSEGLREEFISNETIDSIEFQTQLESLKSKTLISWSGGMNIDANEMENFQRKFAKPMKYFKNVIMEANKNISDLQAFAVVYATDQLSLGDNSKEDVYYLMFGRFDEIKQELINKFNIHYSWPQLSGTSFIDVGKKLSISPELADLAKKFRNIPGLDTYPDQVIQYFFFELISGRLNDELINKKLIFRWNDGSTTIHNPFKWLIPPPEFNYENNQEIFLIQSVITHTFLQKITGEKISLLDLMVETSTMSTEQRNIYFAKRLETSLTRKSIAKQFSTTLANFMENFKTNPAKIQPFMDTAVKYMEKSRDLLTVVNSVKHSIRNGIKNSTGIIKEYMVEVSDEELNTEIDEIIRDSINTAIQMIPDLDAMEFAIYSESDYWKLFNNFSEMNNSVVKSFFQMWFDNIFQKTLEFTRQLEPDRQVPISTQGGLSERTQDFVSTVEHHARKNPNVTKMIEQLKHDNLPGDLVEQIVKIGSYVTYQIASKEGDDGFKMHQNLVEYFRKKVKQLFDFIPANGRKIVHEFVSADLQQSHALISLATKTRVDVYNAWTPLNSLQQKNTMYLNQFVIPNLLYWQRLPKKFIERLLREQLIDNGQIKNIVALTNRLNLIEAYALIIMASIPEINYFEEAYDYLTNAFNSSYSDPEQLEKSFNINPKQGEAEIVQEITHLWNYIYREK